jgi:hypothetical protein
LSAASVGAQSPPSVAAHGVGSQAAAGGALSGKWRGKLGSVIAGRSARKGSMGWGVSPRRARGVFLAHGIRRLGRWSGRGAATLLQCRLDVVDDLAHVLDGPPAGALVKALAEAADVDGAEELA